MGQTRSLLAGAKDPRGGSGDPQNPDVASAAARTVGPCHFETWIVAAATASDAGKRTFPTMACAKAIA